MISITDGLIFMTPEDGADVFNQWMRASCLEMQANEAGDEELAEAYFQMRKGNLWNLAKFACNAGMKVKKMSDPQMEKLAALKDEFGSDKTLAAFLWLCRCAKEDYPTT